MLNPCCRIYPIGTPESPISSLGVSGGLVGRNKMPGKVSLEREIQHLTFTVSPPRVAIMSIKSRGRKY